MQDINEELKKVAHNVLEKLSEFSIPPYPRYYCDAFISALHEHNNPKINSLHEKDPHLFFEEEDNPHFEKSLELARQSLLQFETSTNSIKHISSGKKIQLEDLEESENSEYTKNLLSICADFQHEVVKQLDIADETIENIKKQILEIEKNANVNPLTKLFNKVVLSQELDEIVEHGKNVDMDLFVIILDADDFRTINGEYGHIAGNKTLIYLGKLLKSLLRSDSKLYHSGGEEFTIIMNRATRDEAIKTVERILNDISQSKLFYKGNNIHLTLSCGIAKHQQNDKAKDLIERAGNALEKAKQEGKNCFKEAL